MAKSERQKAKACAWKWFSKYIRARDCLDTMGDLKHGICITCDNVIRFEKMDAGHFIPGRSDAVLFDEHNTHGQCVSCNRFKQGMWVSYEKALLSKYGFAEVARLKELYFTDVKLTELEFREIADYYRMKYKGVCNG